MEETHYVWGSCLNKFSAVFSHFLPLRVTCLSQHYVLNRLNTSHSPFLSGESPIFVPRNVKRGKVVLALN
jgi:hypothetical protein